MCAKSEKTRVLTERDEMRNESTHRSNLIKVGSNYVCKVGRARPRPINVNEDTRKPRLMIERKNN